MAEKNIKLEVVYDGKRGLKQLVEMGIKTGDIGQADTVMFLKDGGKRIAALPVNNGKVSKIVPAEGIKVTPEMIRKTISLTASLRIDVSEDIKETASDGELRKVYITETYGECAYVIITNAPKRRMEKWAEKLVADEEDGISEWLDPLVDDGYYVKVIVDIDGDNGEIEAKELAEVVGYDQLIDLHEYYQAARNN